jgi:hypothetical protein
MKNIQKNMMQLSLMVVLIVIGAGRTLASDHDDKGLSDKHPQNHPHVRSSDYAGCWDHDRFGGVRAHYRIEWSQ